MTPPVVLREVQLLQSDHRLLSGRCHLCASVALSGGMGFDTIHDALQFVEQLAAGTDSLDTDTIGQQLRDLDVYLQQTLKPKARPCILTSNMTRTYRHACMRCCLQRNNEEARKHVQAGRVTVAGQTETLSQADKDQVRYHVANTCMKISKRFGKNSPCDCRQSYLVIPFSSMSRSVCVYS